MQTIAIAADIANFSKPVVNTMGPLLAIGVFVIIIPMEALILRGLKWGSLWISFSDSVFINIVSATVGVLLFAFIPAPFNQLGAPLLLILGAFTVLIEGALLTLKKPRHPLRQAWIAAVAINVVSYAFLSFVLVGVGYLTT